MEVAALIIGVLGLAGAALAIWLQLSSSHTSTEQLTEARFVLGKVEELAADLRETQQEQIQYLLTAAVGERHVDKTTLLLPPPFRKKRGSRPRRVIKARLGDTSGRPYVEGRVLLPRLEAQGDVSFVLDTGADRSVLHYADVVRLGIDVSKLSSSVEGVGLGGSTLTFFEEEAMIVFEATGALCCYLIKIMVEPPNKNAHELPSILGRDILSKWKVTLDAAMNIARIEVREADSVMPLEPPASTQGEATPSL